MGKKDNRKAGRGGREVSERRRSGSIIILECVKALVEFYPKHIEKEDRRFFIPIMDYFSNEERDAMLKEEYEFDRVLIHELYRDKVTKAEEQLNG